MARRIGERGREIGLVDEALDRAGQRRGVVGGTSQAFRPWTSTSRRLGRSDATIARAAAIASKSFIGEVWRAEIGCFPELGIATRSAAAR